MGGWGVTEMEASSDCLLFPPLSILPLPLFFLLVISSSIPVPVILAMNFCLAHIDWEHFAISQFQSLALYY